MGRRMAGSSAHVNDFLLGRDNGEGQDEEDGKVAHGAIVAS